MISTKKQFHLLGENQNIKSDIFTVIECGFKECFICLSQGFNTLVVFTQTPKPSADGLWGLKSLPIKQMPSGLIKAIRAICQWWSI
jgi:hypothetical protein